MQDDKRNLDLGTMRPQVIRASGGAPTTWERPAFQVIPLDCEITAYAPAGDEPLF